MSKDVPCEEGLRALTAKQRAVLDLLIQHKTSKEIARVLGISHYTVDQRLTSARKKIGVTSRKELAALYGCMSAASENISQRPAYQSSYVEFSAGDDDQGGRATKRPSEATKDPISTKSEWKVPSEGHYRVVPELFEGRYGVFFRLAAIVALALMLLLIVLSGLATFGQLSEMLS